MATSKLIKPTNVTVSIPAFTDQPDQRVNSNCIDKIIDGVNVFSSFINNGVSKALTSGNLNDIKTPGRYYATSNVSNIPYAGASGYLDVYVYDSNRVAQTFRQFNDDKVYERRLISGTWGSWTSLNDQIATKSGIKVKSHTMTSSSDSLRLDTIGMDGLKVLRAVVTNVNNVYCVIYRYSTYWYLSFNSVSTGSPTSGTYEIQILYYE